LRRFHRQKRASQPEPCLTLPQIKPVSLLIFHCR
jgi:hypothetical protein